MNRIQLRQVAVFAAALATLSTAQGQVTTTSPPSPTAAARFLEQASFGPTVTSLADVQKLGMAGWIDAQLKLDSSQWSPIPDPSVDAKGNTQLAPAQNAFFVNAVNGPDQLRQRVAFALQQIFVVSGVKLRPESMVPYIRMMQADAFQTYDKILYDVTLSPGMGHYLDMVNNDKPSPGHGANENYAREVLQLFSIGLVQLDLWGRPVLDSKGNQVPTFDQDVIEGFARTFTGWTYAPKAANSRFPNPANWDAPMVAFPNHHDTAPKEILNGVVLPANQTPAQDLQAALTNIASHPNVAPFICRQLIQRMVSSNPSPDYVRRVVDVFNSSPRGNIGAVVKAILLDPEARTGDNGAENLSTKLREPTLWMSALLRGLDASVISPNGLVGAASNLGQQIYYPPTVFNYFLPGYDINLSATQTYNAPEFQLLSEATAELAAGFANTIAFGTEAGVKIDYSSYILPLGTKPTGTQISNMVDALNAALMGGRMPAQMHDVIVSVASKQATPTAMVKNAVYLIASSWDYQVSR